MVLGFLVIYYKIPPDPILIIKAPTLGLDSTLPLSYDNQVISSICARKFCTLRAGLGVTLTGGKRIEGGGVLRVEHFESWPWRWV